MKQKHYAIDNNYTNPDYVGLNHKQVRACIDTKDQFYKGIKLNCIPRGDYALMKAKRFTLNGTNQNVWIPNKHLEKDGTIKEEGNIDYVFIRGHRQCKLAGINLNACLCGLRSNYGRRFVL